MRIRLESDFDLLPCVFSVNSDARPRMITTALLYFEHISLHKLQRILKETKKTFSFLDPINVSKIEFIYIFAASVIKKIIDKCFDESTFTSSEKRSFIHPSIKRQDLDQDNMANCCPVSNLTFLFKVIEQAKLDQLWKALEENKIIPAHQSAYQRLHSTETALVKFTIILSSAPVKVKPLSWFFLIYQLLLIFLIMRFWLRNYFSVKFMVQHWLFWSPI